MQTLRLTAHNHPLTILYIELPRRSGLVTSRQVHLRVCKCCFLLSYWEVTAWIFILRGLGNSSVSTNQRGALLLTTDRVLSFQAFTVHLPKQSLCKWISSTDTKYSPCRETFDWKKGLCSETTWIFSHKSFSKAHVTEEPLKWNWSKCYIRDVSISRRDTGSLLIPGGPVFCPGRGWQ